MSALLAFRGEILSRRLTVTELERCSRHLTALKRIIGPCDGDDLYGLHARDALSQIKGIEEDLNELRKDALIAELVDISSALLANEETERDLLIECEAVWSLPDEQGDSQPDLTTLSDDAKESLSLRDDLIGRACAALTRAKSEIGHE